MNNLTVQHQAALDQPTDDLRNHEVTGQLVQFDRYATQPVFNPSLIRPNPT